MNLEAYFARIGYAGPRTVTRETLAAIVYRHTLSIPFENIDAFLGRRVSLDPDAVAAKLVDGRRGGWCFEQNLLLGEALRQLGFEVTDLAARVLLGRPVDAAVPRTHRVLLVRLDQRCWLADVGFGAQLTPTGILDLALEDAQATPLEQFRLCRAGSERRLEILAADGWLPMFRFDLQPQLLVDFEPANFQLVHDPSSNFTQRLGVSVVARDGRHGLRGRELTFQDRSGRATRRELTTTEVIDALREVFDLRVDRDTAAALAAKLDAQAGSAGLPA
jgi:N-hydroxyarylamine O-acetyltransferase